MALFLKPIRLSLKAKLALMIEGWVVVLVLVTGGITTMREKETLEDELRKRGLALVSDLARFMIRPMLGNDLPTLRRFVNHSMEEEYVRYVIVLDKDGKVMMHNDLSEVGKVYTDALSVAAIRSKGPGETGVHATSREELHCDMYAPIQISGVSLGAVRLGYSHSAIEKEIAHARRQILIVGLLTTIAGGVVAYLLARFITLPIVEITAATAKVADGSLDAPLVTARNDEIGALTRAFNKMTEDLRRTTVSKDFYDSIIESMSDSLIVVGPDAKIRSVNQTTCAMLEYREDELIGNDINVILPAGEPPFRPSDLEKLIKEATVADQETAYATRSGKRIPMHLSLSVLKNKDGKVEGAVCIAKDITERKQAEEILRKSERELHYLSSRLLTAQERERKRLSRELHDELGQSLMVLKLKLRSIREGLPPDQDTLREECDEGFEYINEITESVRRLSRDLSPAILEDLGLSAAIRWLAEAFSGHGRIECSLDMMELENVFSQEEQIIIYRIIQECFTNIAKHAGATRVFLSIREEDGCALFKVEDNGRGFDVQAAFGKDPAKRGLGLAALHERSRMLGGSVNISSRKGTGTRIIFSFPLQSGGSCS